MYFTKYEHHNTIVCAKTQILLMIDCMVAKLSVNWGDNAGCDSRLLLFYSMAGSRASSAAAVAAAANWVCLVGAENQNVWHEREVTCCISRRASLTTQIAQQSRNFNFCYKIGIQQGTNIPERLLNKPYVNDVTLRGKKSPLKGC